MREKFQQRKQIGSTAELSKTQAASNTAGGAGGKQNLSTSFSAMNSSLQ
jgi:hypothetical protein